MKSPYNLIGIACLNPYYNGKYSMSTYSVFQAAKVEEVLILIIMENTL